MKVYLIFFCLLFLAGCEINDVDIIENFDSTEADFSPYQPEIVDQLDNGTIVFYDNYYNDDEYSGPIIGVKPPVGDIKIMQSKNGVVDIRALGPDSFLIYRAEYPSTYAAIYDDNLEWINTIDIHDDQANYKQGILVWTSNANEMHTFTTQHGENYVSLPEGYYYQGTPIAVTQDYIYFKTESVNDGMYYILQFNKALELKAQMPIDNFQSIFQGNKNEFFLYQGSANYAVYNNQGEYVEDINITNINYFLTYVTVLEDNNFMKNESGQLVIASDANFENVLWSEQVDNLLCYRVLSNGKIIAFVNDPINGTELKFITPTY